MCTDSDAAWQQVVSENCVEIELARAALFSLV